MKIINQWGRALLLLVLSVVMVHCANQEFSVVIVPPVPTLLWAQQLPAGNNLYISQQPDLDSLVDMIQSQGINQIIRLNGEEGTGITVHQERMICQQLGVEFYYFNIESKGDRLNDLRIHRIKGLMTEGNTLVHCKHGVHRAGGVVAAYLREYHALSEVAIIDFLHWESLTQNPGVYRRYVEYGLGRKITKT